MRNCNSISELSKSSQDFISNMDVALAKVHIYQGNLVRVIDFLDYIDWAARVENYVDSFILGKQIQIKQYWSMSKELDYNDNARVYI